MHTNKHHTFKRSLKTAASFFLDSPLFFNGPEVPAVPEDQQQDKEPEQSGEQQREKRPTTYRPQQEQEERMQEEENLRKIESRMERSQPQESPEKNREIVKKLNADLERSIAAYPEGLKQTKTFQDALSRMSFGEDNGRTFMEWNVPERLRSVLFSEIGRALIASGDPKAEIRSDGTVRFYESPERLKQSSERLIARLSTGPVEETADDIQSFDREQKVGKRTGPIFVQGELAKELKEDNRFMQKVKDIKRKLHADFGKTRVGTVLLNARFVTDGSKTMMVVPEKNAPEFRTLRKGMPNLFKGDLEKDKDGNYIMTTDERTTKDLLFLFADYTPEGGGIDWEAPAMKAFSKKYPELVKNMQDRPDLSIPERDSLVSLQQTQRVKSVTR
ncbi:MAG: hypothetical protein PHZ25_04350 [Candidatus Pacebacteria bacterium]|nr:hypothetical protein [Candidatus Paceibacterota bacterium]